MEDKEKTAQELLEEASANIEDTKPKDKGSKYKKVIIGVLSLMVVGMVAMGIKTMIDIRNNQDISQNGKIDENNEPIEIIYTNRKYPITMPKWAVIPYASDRDGKSFWESEDGQGAINWAKYSDIGNATSILPPREAGYTDNESDAVTESGAVNPKYSYLLRDTAEYAAATSIQRLINPHFGGWGQLQKHDDIEGTDYLNIFFKGMFTQSWLDSNSNDDLPIMLDRENKWETLGVTGNDSSSGVVFGEIVEDTRINTTMIESELYGIESMLVEVPVVYKAFNSSGKIIETNGILTLKFVQNFEAGTNMSNRLLIDSTNLVIEEW